MANKLSIRLSGTGGQGIILGGIILAEAAILDGKEVVQTQSYGPEARGGASKAEVIISDEIIKYPKVTIPDYLLLMSQEAAKIYASNIKDEGLIVVDNSIVPEIPQAKAKIVKVPISQLAREEIGNELTANILAVGALASAGNIVSLESLEKAVSLRLPRVAQLNIKALNLGWDWGQKKE